ncbi:TPA: hypothetical protein ACIYDK_005199, partial [Escherichia coli]
KIFAHVNYISPRSITSPVTSSTMNRKQHQMFHLCKNTGQHGKKMIKKVGRHGQSPSPLAIRACP